MRTFKITAITSLLCLVNVVLCSQDYPNCLLDGDFNEEVIVSIGGQELCDDNNINSFAAMDAQTLYTYLLSVNEYDCFGRKVYTYKEGASELLFASHKIDYITSQAISLVSGFNGNNNGLIGVFQYLSVLVLQNYYDGVPISENNWINITDICKSLANNTNIKNSSTIDANYLSGYLFATAWANNIPTKIHILNLVKRTLSDYGDLQYWKNYNAEEEYAYYFKVNYLLATFFFFAIRNDALTTGSYEDTPFYQEPPYYLRLAGSPFNQILQSLSTIACDDELLNSTFLPNQEMPVFAANALKLLSYKTKTDNTETLYDNYLRDNLSDVLNCSEYLSPMWMQMADALISNQTDIGYDLVELTTELKLREFPSQHTFEDGKLIIYSGLNTNEVLGLYEGLQQVKAQFFRLFELDESNPVEGDENETVQIRIYKNRKHYQSYNSILFNAPSPGGGVFIENYAGLKEDYATIYTWDRDVNAGESNYTLEELVRHEYTHYLQSRYLIKGLWGERANPFYTNERLIWFEEGMAEFFAGSTATEGVVDRTVIKNYIDRGGAIDLEQATKSGYTLNTYNYGNLIWSNWYNSKRNRFKELANFTRQGTSGIPGFENYLEDAIRADRTNFDSYVDCLRQNDCSHHTPNTQGLEYQNMNTNNIQELKNALTTNVANLSNVFSVQQYSYNEARFRIEGTFSVNNNNTDAGNILGLNNKLDEILIEIQNESNLNNFDFATAYYSNVNTNVNPPTAQFHIVGPLKKEFKNVYPGDVNYDGIVNSQDVMHLGHYLNLNNNQANNVGSIWQPYSRDDWYYDQTSHYCFYGYEDVKHADCNGDGIVNTADMLVIEQNWGNYHDEAPIFQPLIPCFYFDDFSDYIINLEPVGLLDNDSITLNIVLERQSGLPITIYSGFLDVFYSNNITQAEVIFTNSWLGNPSTNFEHLTVNGSLKAESGFIKTDELNSIGSGIIGQIKVIVDPSTISSLEFLVEFGFQDLDKNNYFFSKNVEVSPSTGIAGIGSNNCYQNLIIDDNTPYQNQYNSAGTVETEGYIKVGQNQVVQYNANRVRLNTGFKVKSGATFKAAFDPCQE